MIFNGIAQNNFLTLINTTSDLYAHDIFVIENEYYIIGTNVVNEIKNGVAYHINNEGNIIDTLVLENESLNSTASKGIQLENGNLRIFGTKEIIDSPGFYYITLFDTDENLNLLDETFYDLGTGQMWAHINIAKNENNELVLASIVDGSPPNTGIQYIDKLLMIVSQEGSIVFDSIYNQSSFEITMDFINSPNSDNFILYCVKSFEEGDYLRQVNILDPSLNLIQNFYVEDYSTQASLRWINDEYYLICNKGDYLNNGSWYTSVSKYDTLFNKIDQFYFGSEDTASYPALNNSIAYSNGKIFIGSTYNTQIEPFPIYNSYLRIENLNNDLSLNFQRFFGGDAYYELIDIESTNDGGCILSGNIYSNGEEGPFERDIFILKVDENGLITSTDESPIPVKNAIVTPNPGKEYLQLHSGVYPAVFQLFNMGGQMILEQKINQNTSTIATQSLSAGTYIWQLLKDGKVVESDKWVKE